MCRFMTHLAIKTIVLTVTATTVAVTFVTTDVSAITVSLSSLLLSSSSRSFFESITPFTVQIQSPSLSPITHGSSSSSSSSPSSRSPLASSLTRSVFHSELKTWHFCKSFPP